MNLPDFIAKFTTLASFLIHIMIAMSHSEKVCHDMKLCKVSFVSVKEGEDIELKCSISPAWKGLIIWTKEGNNYPLTLGPKRFYPNERIAAYSSDPNTWNLKIKNCQKSDQGMYYCSDSISNEIMLYYNVSVEKHDQPISTDAEKVFRTGAPGKMKIKGPNVAFVGEPVHIQCRIDLAHVELPPYPFSSFRWFHNGKIQHSNSISDLTITQSWESTLILESEVIVKHVDTKHSGSWVCLYALDGSKFTQKNTATASIYLTVLGSPKSSSEDHYSNGNTNLKPKILKFKDSDYLNDHESKTSSEKKNHSQTSQRYQHNLINAILWKIILWRTFYFIFNQ